MPAGLGRCRHTCHCTRRVPLATFSGSHIPHPMHSYFQGRTGLVSSAWECAWLDSGDQGAGSCQTKRTFVREKEGGGRALLPERVTALLRPHNDKETARKKMLVSADASDPWFFLVPFLRAFLWSWKLLPFKMTLPPKQQIDRSWVQCGLGGMGVHGLRGAFSIYRALSHILPHALQGRWYCPHFSNESIRLRKVK